MTYPPDSNLFQAALACIQVASPAEKVALTKYTAGQWQDGRMGYSGREPPAIISCPGRPEKPLLVHPSRVAKRNLSSSEGRAAFIHALVHIEFNAINLAWDAVYRFRDMPREYYSDWIKVACEEVQHFGMLQERLGKLGCQYGDFPAHDGLWDMALKTAHDAVARMALVPRVLEARGLDVTPGMITRLKQANDMESASVLELILADEVGHVEIGSRWFRYCCRQRGLLPADTFIRLLQEYLPGHVRGPINTGAREQAGFDQQELDYLNRT